MCLKRPRNNAFPNPLRTSQITTTTLVNKQQTFIKRDQSRIPKIQTGCSPQCFCKAGEWHGGESQARALVDHCRLRYPWCEFFQIQFDRKPVLSHCIWSQNKYRTDMVFNVLLWTVQKWVDSGILHDMNYVAFNISLNSKNNSFQQKFMVKFFYFNLYIKCSNNKFPMDIFVNLPISFIVSCDDVPGGNHSEIKRDKRISDLINYV